MLGATAPRRFTPPLRELTPDTSYGFDVIVFAADVLGMPLDPWQEWAVIHGGELLPDGRPRFRKLLLIVARQNGKTHLLVVLALFWLFVESTPLVLGTSTNLDYARESWSKAADIAQEQLTDLVAKRRDTNGEQTLTTVDKARYKIAASTRKGGRSLSVDRLILDELREHDSWNAWNAAYNAMQARPFGQAWAITNQGDARSVVLDSLLSSALSFIDTGAGDDRLGLFEWSAPDGADPEDVDALAAANPNLGRRIGVDALLGDARRAKQAGGEELAGFRTEIMCQRVPLLDPAVDPDAWRSSLVVGDLSAVRSRVACCVDVAVDGQHATLCAAAVLDDGTVRVEVVAAWDSTRGMRRELAGWGRKVKPAVFGWFPSGPAAMVAAEMADSRARGWPPAGVAVSPIKAETAAVCMGFADLVAGGGIVHAGDPLLDAHVIGAQKAAQGDAWRFTRRGAGHVDAAYAAAGAVHLARTLPERPRPMIVTARRVS